MDFAAIVLCLYQFWRPAGKDRRPAHKHIHWQWSAHCWQFHWTLLDWYIHLFKTI